TSSVSTPLNWAGALRSELSIPIATSAMLRGGRELLPEKITSSMSAARIALCDASPITQRKASTRLDLPHPLGPTTPVKPGSIRKSVGSTNDLNPTRRNRVSFMTNALVAVRRAHPRRTRKERAARAQCVSGEGPHRADNETSIASRQQGWRPPHRPCPP